MSRVLAGLLFAALAFAYPAVAQDKKAAKGKERAQKVLIDNDKVRVTETTFKPGEESPSIERPYRITRVLQGGTLELTYPDGKKDKRVYKTGEVREVGPDKAYTAKNVSSNDIVLYSVAPKQAKADAGKKK